MKVLVGLSGGADSSVAAALLSSQGYDLIGAHIRTWDPELHSYGVEFSSRCCQLRKVAEARALCDRLDMTYVEIDGRDMFEAEVLDGLVHDSLVLKTPNPCVSCNSGVKIPLLLEKAQELGCEMVATGHYAQIIHDAVTGMFRLSQAADLGMDQSHLLSGLKQDQLRRLMMPVGGVQRSMVERLARDLGVTSFDAPPDGRCFVADPKFQSWLEIKVPASLRPTGVVRTSTGRVVWDHKGLLRYPLGGVADLELQLQPGEEYYALGYDMHQQTLLVGSREELSARSCLVAQTNWIVPTDRLGTFRCLARLRNHPGLARCQVVLFENDRAAVEFDEPVQGLFPGEPLVFYEAGEVLGGSKVEFVARHEKLKAQEFCREPELLT